MLINQTLIFIFLIVISLVSEYPVGTDAQKANDKPQEKNDKIDDNVDAKCWNGLGKCSDKCSLSDSRKIEYHCEDTRTCCVPNKIVVAVNAIDNLTDTTPLDIPCGLSFGKCEIKCLSPTTVYRGSYNECPKRHFCCIKNDAQIKGKSSLDNSDDSDSTGNSVSAMPSDNNSDDTTSRQSDDNESDTTTTADE